MKDMTAEPILDIRDLHVHFPIGAQFLARNKRTLHAVSGVNLSLAKGECLSIVGESGCGKSTTALAVMGLQEPTSGDILFEGRSIVGENAPNRMERARIAQMVFQDPYASLNPRQTVRRSLAAPLRLHGVTSKSELDDRVEDILRKVDLKPEHAARFPHEFSGGQRQRIGIARALILDPQILMLDEPVSALDVSVRAQIINLLLDLQEDLSLSFVMISHDLGVVEHMSDRVAVMYFGQIVELGPWNAIFANPTHPYTRKLISTIPDPDTVLHPDRVAVAKSDVAPPDGYRFHPETVGRPDVYAKPEPSELIEIGPGHFVRCQPA
ncbi:ATP-binding cassette domain-containing protein [Roseovarius sp. SCSIO 43702]|uniref:ABC transporter ATP-binding protein n=1 Tax=Roseovarius sp. SCSIO 43702 TaxID=2823043 RepID=UPI001C72F6A4|nr:ATP-binding cassette domain-containing protein [Roseovarius sp. SCSIO 43702]QYX56902.1 ATP-binding cassette domain-containing protein [Roseovarius sp. SCSIO 43702]